MVPPDPMSEAVAKRLRVAAALARCPLAVLYRVEAQTGKMICAHGEEAVLAGMPSDVPSWRIAREETTVVPVIGRGPAAPESVFFPPDFRVAALISVPLMSEGTQVGAMVLADSVPRDDFGSLDAEALATVVAMIADALRPPKATAANARMRPATPATALPQMTEELAAWPLSAGNHDAVTGLPDRLMLIQPMQVALDRARRKDRGLAVALFALDRFHRIDDWLGRSVGDELLRQVAERLLETTGESDLVGRGSGDEFVVIFSDVGGGRSALALTDRVLSALREPFHVQGYELSVSATVGVSRYPDHAQDVSALLRYAGIALHRAKAARQRGRIELFTDELREAVERRGDLERHLRRALGAGELLLHYQPKVDIRTRKWSGVEALIRWKRGDQLVSPGVFLPVAEESELIVPIGTWVMLESCRQMRRWHGAGVDLPSVSVNVSAQQFSRPDFVGTVARVLKSSTLPPGALELEVTETSLMDDVGAAAEKLSELRHLGVRVSVDDFGTGYSSLSYLQRLPVDVLKIDRSFVKDLDAEGDGARSSAVALTEAITGLGHSLGLKVLAEGVETEAQLDALAALGCDEVQGYYFSRPVPAPNVSELFPR
ncbi:MAG TPA: hypothetical protein DEF51_44830 [Myxococcales bacterium]|nr:hypothetical protein [Myxococcales bacterium]